MDKKNKGFADKKKIILILGFAGFVAMADNWAVSPIEERNNV